MVAVDSTRDGAAATSVVGAAGSAAGGTEVGGLELAEEGDRIGSERTEDCRLVSDSGGDAGSATDGGRDSTLKNESLRLGGAGGAARASRARSNRLRSNEWRR